MFGAPHSTPNQKDCIGVTFPLSGANSFLESNKTRVGVFRGLHRMFAITNYDKKVRYRVEHKKLTLCSNRQGEGLLFYGSKEIPSHYTNSVVSVVSLAIHSTYLCSSAICRLKRRENWKRRRGRKLNRRKRNVLLNSRRKKKNRKRKMPY